MDLKKIEQIMKLMREHDLNQFQLEDKKAGLKVHLQKGGVVAPQQALAAAPAAVQQVATAAPAVSGVTAESLKTLPGSSEGSGRAAGDHRSGDGLKPNQRYIRSPFVGTYYGAPSPGAEPFVKVGSKVKVGDVLCIVEAMKLMNEIESEVEGTIVEQLVNNEEPLEYDQPIFIVE